MAKQSKSASVKEVKEVKQEVKETVKEVKETVKEPVKEVKQEKDESQKTSRKKKEVVAPVAEPAPVAPAPAPVVEEAAPVEEVEHKRRHVTREDVENDFDSLLQSIDEEVEALRKSEDKKSKGVRFLRSVSKRIRQLRVDSLRVASKKVRRASSESSGKTNSGFMKAVKISKDMQKFTGLKEDQLVSRVEVTRAICDYIKSNNLQNQSDRRHIIPDDKLAKLLGTTDQMRYCDIQKHIQPHFIKTA
jgi:chromatin remodeling complex protein RSC6